MSSKLDLRTIEILHQDRISGYSSCAAVSPAAGFHIPDIVLVPKHAPKACFLLPVVRSMAAQAGASSEAPGSDTTGNVNLVWAATNHGFTSVGGSCFTIVSEAAFMATTPSQIHPKNLRAYHSNLNLAHHAAMTSALLECASFLHGNACREAKRHQLDLLLIAEEGMDELTELLQQGARSESEYSPSYSKSLHEKREI